MNEHANMLFALLRSELADTPLPPQVRSSLTEQMLPELYAIAKRNKIENLLAEILTKQQLFSPKTPGMEKFRKRLYQAVVRHSILEKEQEDACRVLEQAQIPFLPLKGAVIRKYYPAPYLRSSCDVDILVPAELSQKATQVLCEQLRYELRESLSEHDYHLAAPSGATIELHYRLIEDTRLPKASAVLEKVWEHCRTEQGLEYRMELSAEMFMFYHIAHMAKHIQTGGCGVRPFIDLWLLRKHMPMDEEKVRTLMAEGGLENLYEGSVTLSEVWLGQAQHSDLSRAMEEFILDVGNFGTLSTVQTVRAARGESKLRSWFELVFLSRKNLTLLYPQLKEHPGAMPYYQIKRWFKVFRKDKRDTVRVLAASRADVTAQEVDKVSTLFENLGL